MSINRTATKDTNETHMKKQFTFLILFSILIFGSIVPFIANADALPACTASDWSCADWGECHADGNYFQNRTCSKTTSCEGGVASPSTQQICTPPFCTSWTYSDWSSCDPINGTQERTNISSFPNDCIINYSGNVAPITRQRCIPECTSSSWLCGNWNQCSAGGSQTRVCNKTNCQGGTASPETTQSCVFILPTCTSWTYSDWSGCSANGNQTRNVISSSPNTCAGGSPVISQSCTFTPPVPSCTAADWSCANWGACSQNGSQTRTCDKISNCQGGISSPAISQSCAYVAPVPSCTSFNYSSWSQCTPDGKQTRNVTYKYPYNCEGGESKTTQSCTYIPPAPTCDADIWTCGDWNSCSLSGIQNRSCRKTFDCPNVETAPPVTDQYCEAPSRPAQQVPQEGSDAISNQDTIIKATVKLYCPFDEKGEKWSQGSGTVIDPSGSVLTNRHVVFGTLGCLVGFINDFNDEPYFGERQIADIVKVTPNADIAILKIRNPQNQKLTYIDITSGNSNGLHLGDRISIYGYPGAFGADITYTSGDFSGTRADSYLKTTAILEHGNSGGGAYLKNGTFLGIPSEVTVKVADTVNVLGYILPINTINAWLGNSNIVYNNRSSNNYSRVSSILENIDLKNLRSIKVLIPDTDAKGNPVIQPTNDPISAPPATHDQKTSVKDERIKSGQTTIAVEDNNPTKTLPDHKGLLPKLWSWFKGLFGF